MVRYDIPTLSRRRISGVGMGETDVVFGKDMHRLQRLWRDTLGSDAVRSALLYRNSRAMDAVAVENCVTLLARILIAGDDTWVDLRAK